ncbi:MAG: holin family protein [Alphaproteobacteria bacterium]|nr:holin family protein [Alphaproteobacteria bacterium]MDA7988273.1 holin family protein [Alphaproteobacteria bacterium]MDA8008620.1 holin family protein [Alphaproteobacteria bacterium]MDA8031361.1 holin family protein [Alphaproteobacteria bacterium]
MRGERTMSVAGLVGKFGVTALVDVLLPGLRSLSGGDKNGDKNGAGVSDAVGIAGAAVHALEALRTELSEDGRLDAEQLAEANRHTEEALRLKLEHERVLVGEVNRSLRAEVGSEDSYVRRWRPTFGYAVALAWTVQTAALTWAIVVTPDRAGEILSGMAELSIVWGVALSVLGVGVVKRSHDKEVLGGVRRK